MKPRLTQRLSDNPCAILFKRPSQNTSSVDDDMGNNPSVDWTTKSRQYNVASEMANEIVGFCLLFFVIPVVRSERNICVHYESKQHS